MTLGNVHSLCVAVRGRSFCGPWLVVTWFGVKEMLSVRARVANDDA